MRNVLFFLSICLISAGCNLRLKDVRSDIIGIWKTSDNSNFTLVLSENGNAQLTVSQKTEHGSYELRSSGRKNYIVFKGLFNDNTVPYILDMDNHHLYLFVNNRSLHLIK